MSTQKYPQTQTKTSTSTSTSTRKRREGGYTQVKNHAKQDRKRAEAYARQDAYERLTFQQQLDGLGKTGSNRQRKRILAAMGASPTTVETAAPTKVKKIKVKA